MAGKILAVCGAQYGSEGKGVIVAHIANQYNIHIRVGGPNAGHSFMNCGKLWKMQVIPCGWKNPNARLYIGRGGLIDLELLTEEIDRIRQFDTSITDRLFIDAKTGVLSKTHKQLEGGTEGEMHFKIGSTGEGVGKAREARISRDVTRFQQAKDVMFNVGGNGWSLDKLIRENTTDLLNQAFDHGASILIEGTQGFGLSLIHGPWPFCTSADTNSAQLAADIGLSPRIITDIMLVCRTYPIRVWGNSGPMYKEITWDEISQKMGREIREMTTVTKKLRRVGMWDEGLFREAVNVNRPTEIAMTFLDYLSPTDEGKFDYNDFSEESRKFINYVSALSKAPVKYVCTGWSKEKNDWVVVETPKAVYTSSSL